MGGGIVEMYCTIYKCMACGVERIVPDDIPYAAGVRISIGAFMGYACSKMCAGVAAERFYPELKANPSSQETAVQCDHCKIMQKITKGQVNNLIVDLKIGNQPPLNACSATCCRKLFETRFPGE